MSLLVLFSLRYAGNPYESKPKTKSHKLGTVRMHLSPNAFFLLQILELLPNDESTTAALQWFQDRGTRRVFRESKSPRNKKNFVRKELFPHPHPQPHPHLFNHATYPSTSSQPQQLNGFAQIRTTGPNQNRDDPRASWLRHYSIILCEGNFLLRQWLFLALTIKWFYSVILAEHTIFLKPELDARTELSNFQLMRHCLSLVASHRNHGKVEDASQVRGRSFYFSAQNLKMLALYSSCAELVSWCMSQSTSWLFNFYIRSV